MSGFYQSFTFRSNYGITYFLPLKLKTDDNAVAENCFMAMKTALADKFEILDYSKPVRIISNINESQIRSVFVNVTFGKMNLLNVTEWKFDTFQPDITISLNKNASNALNYTIEEFSDQLEMGFYPKIATMISEYKFPVQVVSNIENWQVNEYLTTELISVNFEDI